MPRNIGVALTFVALFNSYRAMRRGDRQATQRMFRARVYAQAFTILAVVAGGAYYGADRRKAKELGELKAKQEAEERRQQWIRELEVRDDEDRMLKDRMSKKRDKREARGAGSDTKTVPEAAKSEGGGGGGGGGMFGGWFGGSSKPSPPPAEPAKEVEKPSEPKK